MELNNRYHTLFGRIPIFGMLHLAGSDPVRQALDELAIFEEEGVDGAIVENYHGSISDIIATLQATSERRSKVIIGVNVLPNEFDLSFDLASKYSADFIQLDHVAGKYERGELDTAAYARCKAIYGNIVVLGGVWPKYYAPVDGSDVEADVRMGMQRAEAIVVTGEGTGMETPMDKIVRFRKILDKHTLVIGAGLTPDNAYEQLRYADGAIVGSCLKVDNDTRKRVDRARVHVFMDVVRQARTDWAYLEEMRRSIPPGQASPL